MKNEHLKRSTQVAIFDRSRPRSATGTTIVLPDSVNGYIKEITVKGRSSVVEGEIVSVGDNGFTITTTDGTNTSEATITTGIPLRSVIGNIFDILDNAKVLTKCAIIDMGSLTWTYSEEYSRFTASVSGMKRQTTNAERLIGILSAVYPISTSYNVSEQPDKSIMRVQARVFVRDDTYGNDAAAFTTAMLGKKLVYELATPTETPLTSEEIAALAALRTYFGGTTITATDSPEMTVTYSLLPDPITRTRKRTARKPK